MLTIGSRALKAHGLHLDRPSYDVDYITSYEEYEKWVKRGLDLFVRSVQPLSDSKIVAKSDGGEIFEFEIAWPGTSGALLLREYPEPGYAPLEVCLALKLSHRYLKNSPAFRKTMDDIWLLRKHGVVLNDWLQGWLKIREAETYNYKHPNLNQGKMGFFSGDGVKYVYDHDSIHRSIQHLDKPAYEYYKGDGKEVSCDKFKFAILPRETQLYGVLEEAYVLALERSQIPYPGQWTPRKSFEFALMKVCTSITSGWFREFAWENYHQVMELYKDDYVDRFNQAVASGVAVKL